MSELIIQPSTIDTCLAQSDPDGIYGASVNIIVCSRALYYNEAQHGVLQFDFSALPDGAVISAATLNLYDRYGNAVGRTYWAYELTRPDWVELEATWNSYKSGSPWTTPGGDYITDNGASQIVPSTPNWMNWDVLALLQHFQSAHGKVANFLVRDETEDYSYFVTYFWPREWTDPTLCPKLAITYTSTPPSGPAGIKTINGIAIASVKTINGIATGSIKSWNGLT